jgi:hypothetical protein
VRYCTVVVVSLVNRPIGSCVSCMCSTQSSFDDGNSRKVIAYPYSRLAVQKGKETVGTIRRVSIKCLLGGRTQCVQICH